MEIKALISKLHPFERKVLPYLKQKKELVEIVAVSGLQEIEVMRALQWLENKKLLILITEKKKVVNLDSNGLKYQKDILPERKIINELTEQFQSLSTLSHRLKLSLEEINACIGQLKQRMIIDLKKEKDLMIKFGPQGKKFLTEKTIEEKFLIKSFPIDYNSLSDVDRFALDELKKRKDFIKIEEVKSVTVTLTDLGKKLASLDLTQDVVNRLNTGMLKTGDWKNKEFRAYDVEINVPSIYPGKIHFVNQAIDYAKTIWTEMGFKEMTGGLVATSFFNFDALFVPQDHPARELQDTFYLGGKFEKGKLPDADLVKKVKAAHENGSGTKSKGWNYIWNPEEAKKNVLRTHTTVLTSQTLFNLKGEKLPIKRFAIGRCFRNEALDWKHLFEFNQTEGIVIDENANFRHLLGYLKEFFKKMGYPQARFRPAYFPYTEPSVEIDVFHPVRKEWVELGGAGMLRPEVVIPLFGRDVPVLAWGPGFDRIIMEYYQITDLRNLYQNDFKQLREIKSWLK